MGLRANLDMFKKRKIPAPVENGTLIPTCSQTIYLATSVHTQCFIRTYTVNSMPTYHTKNMNRGHQGRIPYILHLNMSWDER
jgi:hypothetical protein